MSVSSTFLKRWRAEREELQRRQQLAAQQLDRIRQDRELERERRLRVNGLRAQVLDDLATRRQLEQQQQARNEEQQRLLRSQTLQGLLVEQRQQVARVRKQETLRHAAVLRAQEREEKPPASRIPEKLQKPQAAAKPATHPELPRPQLSRPKLKDDLIRRTQRQDAQRQAAAAARTRSKETRPTPTERDELISKRRAEESIRQRSSSARTKELERRAEFRLSRPELPGATQESLPTRPALASTSPRPPASTRTPMRSVTLPGTPQAEEPTLSWLSTQGSFIVDENGNAVSLRGVTVTGLDTVAPSQNQTVAQALTLDESGLSNLADGWGVNLIRIPFTSNSILSGTGSLAAADLLNGLDDLIAQAEQVGCYVLLALKPAQEADTILPGDNDYVCMQNLATRYRDEPAVLYEPFASTSVLAHNWLGIAQAVIGTIRRAHPASLLFLGNGKASADVQRLPLTFTTGDPIYNVVYTIRLTPAVMNTVDRPSMQALSRNYPIFVSQWSDGGPNFGRSSELAADLIERFAAGWSAGNWNSDPRLVVNASAHQYSATRWGMLVQRALGQPTRPLLTAYDGGGDTIHP